MKDGEEENKRPLPIVMSLSISETVNWKDVFQRITTFRSQQELCEEQVRRNKLGLEKSAETRTLVN